MVYRMHYTQTKGERAFFDSNYADVRLSISLTELNPLMMAELKSEDPDLTIEVTVMYVDKG